MNDSQGKNAIKVGWDVPLLYPSVEFVERQKSISASNVAKLERFAAKISEMVAALEKKKEFVPEAVKKERDRVKEEVLKRRKAKVYLEDYKPSFFFKVEINAKDEVGEEMVKMIL